MNVQELTGDFLAGPIALSLKFLTPVEYYTTLGLSIPLAASGLWERERRYGRMLITTQRGCTYCSRTLIKRIQPLRPAQRLGPLEDRIVLVPSTLFPLFFTPLIPETPDFRMKRILTYFTNNRIILAIYLIILIKRY
jgi:hypothetical protein